MSTEYRKILVALMKRQLRRKLEKLSEVVGSEFEGVNTRDPAIRSVFLEILGQAFYDLHAEFVNSLRQTK